MQICLGRLFAATQRESFRLFRHRILEKLHRLRLIALPQYPAAQIL
jgi:hypothetical protein